jgi:cation transport ATPase
MAAAGLITPIFAAVLMSFSTVIVAINAATMRYKNK